MTIHAQNPAVQSVDALADGPGWKRIKEGQSRAPAWRVVPSNYPGSPVYAVVDECNTIAADSLDGRLCVFTTRATAEYQLSRNGHRFQRSSERP